MCLSLNRFMKNAWQSSSTENESQCWGVTSPNCGNKWTLHRINSTGMTATHREPVATAGIPLVHHHCRCPACVLPQLLSRLCVATASIPRMCHWYVTAAGIHLCITAGGVPLMHRHSQCSTRASAQLSCSCTAAARVAALCRHSPIIACINSSCI